MATSLSAKKRIRQNETSRLANKSKRSAMRSAMKRVLTSIEEQDGADAKTNLPKAMSLIDKAAKGNAIHRNTASRRKARLARALNRLTAETK
jgi:small subunit ribosomal protein S20